MNCLMLVTACCFLVADPSGAAKADLEKMQGNWDAVTLERDGKATPTADVVNYTVEIKGDKRVLKMAGTLVTESTITLDPSKTPKQIDIKVLRGTNQGLTLPGIYSIEGDAMKVCLSLTGDDRPTEFSTKAESGHNYQVFKRAKPITEPTLREELVKRMQKDQEVRIKLQQQRKEDGEDIDTEQKELTEKAGGVDKENTAWMKTVIEKHRWPGFSKVGKDGALAAFLLIQHADQDKPFQKQCLELMRDAVKAGDASGRDLAYLTDRVLIGEGKKQLYGTQLRMVEGKLQASPIEDEEKVDERRKEVGLMPLADYIKIVRSRSGDKG